MKKAALIIISLFLVSTVFAVERRVPTPEYPTIQAAIDAAEQGDEVVVEDGTYTGEGNRDIDFRGKAITVRSESGPENCIIDCNGARFGFYLYREEDTNSVLDGFSITHARESGIFCCFSGPTITNCIITDNGSIVFSSGGGICCDDRASPTITNCIITKNMAREGGGIICRGYNNPKIIDCIISDNKARDFGGGIYCESSKL